MAEQMADADKKDYRAFVRGKVSIAASIRTQDGARQIVEIVDLSQAGFRMRSDSFLIPERALFLTLLHYSPMKARIAWTKEELYGCEFIQPLHTAIFEDIVKRYPQLSAPTNR